MGLQRACGMSRPLRLDVLIVWQLACEFEGRVLDLVKRTPAAGRDYKFTSQLTDAATSVPSNIAEGFHRFRAPEFAQFLRYSRASLAEAEKRLNTGVRRSYFRQAEIDPLLRLARRLGKGTMNFHDYLLRQATEKKAREKARTP
ncbi:MAG: four helix bundle protein [Acidobacteriota bacterium]|nr:four helix bundle protein [Acidobacteriota bacterium]